MKRVWQLLKDYALVIVVIIVAGMVTNACRAQEPKHSIRASVRPNDSTKYVASLPWVSEYPAPEIYAAWWREIAHCMKLELPEALAKRETWVEINSKTFRLPGGFDDAFGFTDEEHNTIYIALASQLEKEVVLHEMAHQLNYWYAVDEGVDYHPPDVFENPECGLHTHHKAI